MNIAKLVAAIVIADAVGGSLGLLVAPIVLIAVAALLSLAITLFKGMKDLVSGKGFFKPDSTEVSKCDQKQKKCVMNVFNVYCALRALGANNDLTNNQNLNKPQEKFLQTMKDMKNFIKKNKNIIETDTDNEKKLKPLEFLRNIENKENKVPLINNNQLNNNQSNNNLMDNKNDLIK